MLNFDIGKMFLFIQVDGYGTSDCYPSYRSK